MARRAVRPILFAGAALDPWDAVWDPPLAVDVSSDEDDAQEEVSMPFLLARLALPLPPAPQEEEDDEEEQEEWGEEEEDWDDADSAYGRLSEEDRDEEEDMEVEEDDQAFRPEEFWARGHQGAPPAQAVEVVGRPAAPIPQQQAESLSPPSCPVSEEEHRPSPDVLPLGGSKRHREEEDGGLPSSKRPCTEDPAPSTSSGTSLHFPWYFRLLQDPDSDDD